MHKFHSKEILDWKTITFQISYFIQIIYLANLIHGEKSKDFFLKVVIHLHKTFYFIKIISEK